MSKKSRRTWSCVALAALVAGVVFPAVVAADNPPAGGCTAQRTPVYQTVNPSTSAALLTTVRSEYDNAAVKHGFVDQSGIRFRVATTAATGSGLVPVHRLQHPRTGDFVYLTRPTEITNAVAKYGYVDGGARFQVRSRDGAGCVPIHRLVRGALHRHVVADEVPGLVADGWRDEGVRFYAAPAVTVPTPTTPPPTTVPPTSAPTSPPPTTVEPTLPGEPEVLPPTGSATRFSFVVFGDTQTWTSSGDPRFRDATRWIADNREAADIRWVMHTGDFTNWGWVVPSQLDVAERAMQNLQDAGIPFAVAIGNHDTRAVGHDGKAGSRAYGGSAYVGNPECVERFPAAECVTSLLLRHTEEINERFDATRFGSVAGQFEAGKIDNIFQTFEGGGRQWMVLSLEVWPRREVVAWANDVVAAHPNHNVLVQTHSFVEGDGSIVQNNGGYGSTSGQHLYDNLIKLHPNISMTFSGHTGRVASRTDTGVNGNLVHSFLNNDPVRAGAVIRVVTVDTAAATATSRLYDRKAGQWLHQYDVTRSLTLR